MSNFNKEELLEQVKDWHNMLKAYQVPDTKKAVIQMITSYGPFLALWVAQFYLYHISVWAVVGIAVLNGFLLGRIFIIQHDCGHKSFLKSQLANDIIGTINSFFTFIPYKYWAVNHNFHHNHNGQLEYSDIGDIECLTVEQYAALSWFGKLRYRVYRHPLYLFTIGGFIYVTLYNRFAFLKEGVFATARRTVKWANLFYALVYFGLGYIIGFEAFAVVQLINLLFFGSYALWFFYIQHQYEAIYKSSKDNWNYVVSALKGSTYYDLPAIGHWLTGNIGYHHIHHLSPAIPNYNLKACNQAFPVFEQNTNKISLWQSFKTVFANLYDEQSEKMISFRAYRLMKRTKKINL
jgi:omega-6 fatty acid desaturase (delta-12 desaturase)